MASYTKNKALLSAIVFWGAAWGFAEATLGYVLHMLHVPAVGAWMFPVALFCMFAAMRHSGQASTPFAVAAVAAAVKLSDLLFIAPLPFWYVTNPAGHILIEGAMTALFVFVVDRFAIKRFQAVAATALTAMASVVILQILWQLAISETVDHNPAIDLLRSDGSRMLLSLAACIAKSLILSGAWIVYTAFSRRGKAIAIPVWSASLALASALCITWITA